MILVKVDICCKSNGINVCLMFNAINKSEHSHCSVLTGRIDQDEICIVMCIFLKSWFLSSCSAFTLSKPVSLCVSTFSLCVWILMLWSSYRARNPTRTKTPIHNPKSPPTTQHCGVTKHITYSVVPKCLHVRNDAKLQPKPWQSWVSTSFPSVRVKVDHICLSHI